MMRLIAARNRRRLLRSASKDCKAFFQKRRDLSAEFIEVFRDGAEFGDDVPNGAQRRKQSAETERQADHVVRGEADHDVDKQREYQCAGDAELMIEAFACACRAPFAAFSRRERTGHVVEDHRGEEHDDEPEKPAHDRGKDLCDRGNGNAIVQSITPFILKIA